MCACVLVLVRRFCELLLATGSQIWRIVHAMTTRIQTGSKVSEVQDKILIAQEDRRQVFIAPSLAGPMIVIAYNGIVAAVALGIDNGFGVCLN